jgi:putative membrane protein
MIKTCTQCTAVAALFFMLAGCAQSTEQLGGSPSPTLNDMDNNFFKTITVANMAEIDSSRLALTKSQSTAVRDFAQKMIDDHTMASNEVAAVAAYKQVMLPSQLDSQHQVILDDLKGKSGADCDKAYIDFQVKAHQETINADQDEANNGTDTQVKGLAAKLLDTLKMHLQMAEKIQAGDYGQKM